VGFFAGDERKNDPLRGTPRAEAWRIEFLMVGDVCNFGAGQPAFLVVVTL